MTVFFWNNVKAMELLVKVGADPSIKKNNEGETALDIANRIDIINYLSDEIPFTKRAQ
jgi:ankyrin repeat protein